jgi:hypothetical protein
VQYDKINKIKVINARSIGTVEVDFEVPIVALTGTNEAGKSSFIRAFGAAAGNLNRTKQNQYVRTGQTAFGVLVELEGGTKVIRKKGENVNDYTLILPDGTRRDATKVAATMPDYVDAVMGFFRDAETGESLQVRTCGDPLLFVDTTDGQNYKALHNAINNLDIREATIKAKADAARLSDEAAKKRDEVEIYGRQLSACVQIDVEYLKVILSATERAASASTLFDAARQAMRTASVLDGYDALSGCETVDDGVCRDFMEAMRHLETFRSVSVTAIDGAGTVDAQALSLFERGRSLISATKVCGCDVTTDLVLVSDRSKTLFDKAIQAVCAARDASERFAKMEAVIAAAVERLKSFTVTVVCPECGADVPVLNSDD